MYGKQTQRAIGAMSRLAEVWDGAQTRLSAVDIAQQRALPGPMLAKILTSLSQANLIVGSPGPGGGYALSRAPAEISFQEVADVFEREDPSNLCPFGGGICGVGKNCALPDKLVEVQRTVKTFLAETTFEIFRRAAQDEEIDAEAVAVIASVMPSAIAGAIANDNGKSPRESFRVRERRPL